MRRRVRDLERTVGRCRDGRVWLPDHRSTAGAILLELACVILAPHLTRLRRRDLGLPHEAQATDAERAR